MTIVARSFLITTDPNIMGGEPVFRVTPVPVHAIAAQVQQDDSDADILAS
jgi:uncharacterized protein (DUF433 family)